MGFLLTSAAGGGQQSPASVGGINLATPQANNYSTGTGSPQNVVVGSPGDLYINLSGGAGTTLWVKESGAATNTGWVGK